MIYEFALDPLLAARWCERREFQRYQGKFGVGTPRVMCRLPYREWRRLVWAAFDDLVRDAEPAKQQALRKNLDAILSNALAAGTSRRSCAGGTSWFELAMQEHTRRPFQGVLISEGTVAERFGTDLLRDGEFDQDVAPWSPEHGLVRRTPEALAKALAPLLNCARHIRLVDPHFAPDKRKWRHTIALLLAQSTAGRTRDEFPAVEIHTCVSRGRGMRPIEGQTIAEQEAKAGELAKALDRMIPDLPSGLSLTVWFWAEKEGGPEFHDRFLMTDIGGLQFGKGLDASDHDGARDESITLTPKVLLRDLWRRYDSAGTDFLRRGTRTIVAAGA